MVVRLGQTAHIDVGNRYRVRQGMALQLQYASSQTVTVRAWCRVRYDNGEDDTLFIADQSLSNDRAMTVTRPSDVARLDGWVTDALVELPLDATIERGEVYVRLFLDPFGPLLCSDYCYSNFGQVALGTYIQPGPGGGAGSLSIVTVKANGAPAASTTHVFAVTNTIRKIYEFVWYYNCSADVASRVLSLQIQLMLGPVPTGMTDPNIQESWRRPTITLTANFEGMVFIKEKYSGGNLHGTLVIDDNAAVPSPFPLLIEESDNRQLLALVTDGEVLDADAMYLLQEEWVIPH